MQQLKSPNAVELCSPCHADCTCSCRHPQHASPPHVSGHRDNKRPVHVDGRAGRLDNTMPGYGHRDRDSTRPANVDARTDLISPPAHMLTPTLNRRQTVSSPATAALPSCGICRPLPYSCYADASDSYSTVAVSGEDPQSLAVEVDSDQFVDVAVGTDRLPLPVGSESTDSVSSQHHAVKQISAEAEPQWTEITKFRFCFSTE